MPHTLSLTVIVKNEEVHLPNLLETASIYADEIIIVDTGSTDRTKDIAQKHTDKILDFVWCDDFAKARNVGIEQCTSDFIIWLDADDVVPKDMAEKIKELKNNPIDWDVLFLPYIYSRTKDGQPLLSQVRERIFRNNKGLFFEFPIHECLKLLPDLKEAHNDAIHIVHNKIVAHEPSVTRNLRILSKAVETPEYQNNARVWSYLAQESEPQKAIAYYTRLFNEMCLDANKQWLSETTVHFGRKYLAIGDYETALSIFGEAMIYYPLWREPYFYAGQAYFYLARYKEGLHMMLIAGNIPPPAPEVHVIYDMSIYTGDWYYEWLFYMYHYLLDRTKALDVLNDALKRNPASETFLRLQKEKHDWLYPKDAEKKSL